MVGNLLSAELRAAAPNSAAAAPIPHLSGFLAAAGLPQRTMRFAPGAIIFAQGAPADSVYLILNGAVKLSVLSAGGKEAVVAILGPGDFFGEGCLTTQPRRPGTAGALVSTLVVAIDRMRMTRTLRCYPELSAAFLAQMLIRNIRTEEDLVDQLSNSSEKRLARTLMTLARAVDGEGPGRKTLPQLSQETLANMVGTTRSRVNFFMNRFRRLGLVEYGAGDGVMRIDAARLGDLLLD